MDVIKKIFRPDSIPFFSKKGNNAYSDLLNHVKISCDEKYQVKRIIQEIRSANQFVVSSIDCDLTYIHIKKNGRISEFDLTNSKLENSTKSLFERCDNSIEEIENLNSPNGSYLDENGIRLTFVTSKTSFCISGELDQISKRKIFGQTISHFLNLVGLTDPIGFQKKLKNSR